MFKRLISKKKAPHCPMKNDWHIRHQSIGFITYAAAEVDGGL